MYHHAKPKMSQYNIYHGIQSNEIELKICWRMDEYEVCKG